MFRSLMYAWRPAVLAAALLIPTAVAPQAYAAGHGGGSHGGGFHGGGSHGGSFHGGGFHSGGFHSGGFRSGGFHSGGFHSGYRPGYFGGYHSYGAYRPWHGYGYGSYGQGLYSSPAYFSGGYDVTPDDSYYSPDLYTEPDDTPTGQITAEAAAPVVSTTPAPAIVDVYVPADAQLWFNGSVTTTTGEERQFVTPPLSPDQNYTYDVRARWTDDGKVVDETRHIEIRANNVKTVDFTQPEPAGLSSK